MKLHRGMSEIDFIEAIDASFSFESNEEYEEATRIACSISDNATLMVGYELASLSSHAPLEVNLRLLEIMKKERPTSIILAAIPVIERLLKKEKVSSVAIHNLLELSRQHGNAWNGLGIVETADASLEKTCQEIYDGWQREHENGEG